MIIMVYPPHNRSPVLPKRIILVRHGESQGNSNPTAYTTIPDHKIRLTPLGVAQARIAGNDLKNLVSCRGAVSNWRVYFYVSPYERTRSTLREIGRSFNKKRVMGVREECRIREQDFGNFQVAEKMKEVKEMRHRFGRFFYRFPEGESAADVFDRVSIIANWRISQWKSKLIDDYATSGFLESLWRDLDLNRLNHDPTHELNLIIVSHGLTSRVFLMKWFKWTVEQFESLNNLNNCEFRVMQLGPGGEYSLAIHHTEEEMLDWGLSPQMINDQKCRALAATKPELTEKCRWDLDGFFDYMADDSDDEEDDVFCPCEE